MTLLEGYIAKWNSYPQDEVKIRVARPSLLSPSKELLSDWKANRITWKQYEERFREQILSNEDARLTLVSILVRSRERNVRLICYERAEDKKCHRFILMKMVEEMIL